MLARSGAQGVALRPSSLAVPTALVRPCRVARPGPHVSSSSICGSVSASAASWASIQPPAESSPCLHSHAAAQAAGILETHKRVRSFLMIVGGIAAWAYLSAGAPTGPFASLSLATMGATTGSAELAAKSAWTGLATGVFHTLCGPDHLAGLAPLSIGRGRLAACALGTLWGFGHSTGQLILGLGCAMLKDKFNDFMPALDKWSAYIVPLTLITIGVVGLYESYGSKQEDEHQVLALEGAGGAGATASTVKKSGERVGFTTYFTGIVHGLQPDALYVVIPALALPTKLAAVSFITMFVIGTCAAMGGYTLLIGTTSKALIKEQPWLQSHLSSIACGFAILCGVLMLLAGQGVPVPFFS